MPLKTYLPDGDIDLTALSSPNVEEALARDVLAILKEEEYNENAEFELKDTQFIDAEVFYTLMLYFLMCGDLCWHFFFSEIIFFVACLPTFFYTILCLLCHPLYHTFMCARTRMLDTLMINMPFFEVFLSFPIRFSG